MNLLVIGRKGEGKSTLALFLARRDYESIIIWDPRGIFEGDVYATDPVEVEDLFQQRFKGTIVYQPSEGDLYEQFDALADVLCPADRGSNRGGYCLIVDEAGELQAPNSINTGLRRLIKQHKSNGSLRTTIIQTSHQLADWNRSSKGLMDDLYIFRLKAPRDIQAVREYCGDEVAEIVPTLAPHCLVLAHMNARVDDEQFETWDNPSVWYVHMGQHSIDERGTNAEESRREMGL